MTEPLVSVCMITYNHEKYIAQAIEGVLLQITDFRYELVIGEDCSLDGTRSICVDYQRKHPETIRLYLREHNLGMMPNFIETFQACSGKYIALCEGDDYWIDPYKMQKQVDFLEGHPECAICFHDVRYVYEDSNTPQRILPNYSENQREIYTVEDLLVKNFIPTLSVMFKNGLINPYPDWLIKSKIGDWPLHVLNALHGDIGYIHQEMGVYRVHRGGSLSCKNQIAQLETSLQVREEIKPHLDKKYRAILNNVFFRYYYRLASLYSTEGNSTKSRRYLRRSISIKPFNNKILTMDFWRFFIYVYFPFLLPPYHLIKKLFIS